MERIKQAEAELVNKKEKRIFEVLVNLMNRLWDNNPTSRPSSKEG